MTIYHPMQLSSGQNRRRARRPPSGSLCHPQYRVPRPVLSSSLSGSDLSINMFHMVFGSGLAGRVVALRARTTPPLLGSTFALAGIVAACVSDSCGWRCRRVSLPTIVAACVSDSIGRGVVQHPALALS
ncbi:hypothetical protein GALMADRAFT_765448 [Galerina marginata CBS 339.88]|uniref:Uncharacterized protein n=1 Tax=Galerina marginata (strain CBS 339.88) TaxID=685588 RepID=A0A067SZG9_GALM3|nr:hypothetical protein GALMADRAFT_765448 [Galerina marginata CBS 339.88]